MSAYIRLDQAPQFVLNYPSCGTSWDSNSSDGDEGELYPDWAGEELDGPVLSETQAQDVASYRQRLERHKRYGVESPNLWPKPIVPRGLPTGFEL